MESNTQKIKVKDVLGDYVIGREQADRLVNTFTSNLVLLDFEGVETLSPTFLHQLLYYEDDYLKLTFLNLSPVKRRMLNEEREELRKGRD